MSKFFSMSYFRFLWNSIDNENGIFLAYNIGSIHIGGIMIRKPL
jgi:hypothetical protein